MSRALIVEQAPGELALSGVLDYRSGPALREQGGRLIRATVGEACVIDCAAVEKSSSVGLSLLLAFMRDARAAGKRLSIRDLPADMSGIAKVCELHEVLSLESR
ncbi:STAS domain-containing protein [Phytopseudomonas dryadis]|uniref:Anti-anti-sigma factor n=1 Tax=Phytopseudomonas dryadis TaxID=2487520 RepID=A0A4Q9QZ38_9GAMM|nr:MULTISPECIES: STAS domain-containing protein [Pseudomonas]TBU89467.1 anti-anti-sigma factor [Pseudomonas dryadis]TBV04112.1 anti-anti-sigma factor [Pseudomonas dryadis]TBV16996.1 anti-anti-sigma factor [Pseudomonas sp. FRB 230]